MVALKVRHGNTIFTKMNSVSIGILLLCTGDNKPVAAW